MLSIKVHHSCSISIFSAMCSLGPTQFGLNCEPDHIYIVSSERRKTSFFNFCHRAQECTGQARVTRPRSSCGPDSESVCEPWVIREGGHCQRRERADPSGLGRKGLNFLP